MEENITTKTSLTKNLNKLSWTSVVALNVDANANIKTSFITQGCMIDGEVKNSVLFTGAKVAAGAKVIDSVLMPGVVVEEGAIVERALVANEVKVGKQAIVGSSDSEHIELVAKRVKGVE